MTNEEILKRKVRTLIVLSFLMLLYFLDCASSDPSNDYLRKVCTATTSGEVVSAVCEKGERYSFIVKYIADKKELGFKLPSKSKSLLRPYLERPVIIHYNPKDPREYYVKDEVGNKAISLPFILFAATTIFIYTFFYEEEIIEPPKLLTEVEK